MELWRLLQISMVIGYLACGSLLFYAGRFWLFPDGNFVAAIYLVNFAGGISLGVGGWLLLAWLTHASPWKLNTLGSKLQHAWCLIFANVLYAPIFNAYLKFQIAPESHFIEGMSSLLHVLSNYINMPIDLCVILVLMYGRQYSVRISLLPCRNTLWRWIGHGILYIWSIFEIFYAMEYVLVGGLLYEAACCLLFVYLLWSSVSGIAANTIDNHMECHHDAG